MSRGKSFSYSAESMSLSSFLQIVMVVIVILQHHHHQTCDATTIINNQTYCPPSSCGEITNITHPFRLKGDPISCGDPRHELSCKNNMTVLTLYSGKYYVKSINYKNYTIRLVDPGIEEGNCSSIPRYFLTSFNFTSSYSGNGIYHSGDPYQIDSYYGYIIYLNCTKPVKDNPSYVDTASCRVNSNSKSYVYAFAGANYGYYFNSNKYLTVGRFKDDCEVKLVALSSLILDIPNVSDDVPFRPISYKEIYGMLLYGFELSWLSGSCRELCGDNKDCQFNQTTGDVDCLESGFFGPAPVPETGYCRYPWRLGQGCYQMPKLRILVGDFIRDVLFGINKGRSDANGGRIGDEHIHSSAIGGENRR